MPKVRNISPLGDLFVPSLGVTVPSGAVLALDDDQQDVADALASQSEAWVEVVPRKTAAPEPTVEGEALTIPADEVDETPQADEPAPDDSAPAEP